MRYSKTNFCIISAGGCGRRLWPVSTEEKPKQFLNLTGYGPTLIQRTYERISQFILPENIYVCTLHSYVNILRNQLPQLAESQILAEPVQRGTLAPVTWGTSVIASLCPEANIITTPADQEIDHLDAFEKDILQGMDFVHENDGVLALGITPTRPETGYGYIQKGDAIPACENIYQVKTFTEKPDQSFATMFVSSQEFLWNTGLFIFNARYMLNNILKHVPEYRDELPQLASITSHFDPQLIANTYATLPKLSLEYALLEHTQHRYAQACHFRWADMGTWTVVNADLIDTLHRETPHKNYDIEMDEHDNIILRSTNKAIFDNASENMVRLPDGHLAVISGLQGYLVIEENGIIMICPKNDQAAMRRLRTLAHLDDK